ncbi:MAG: transglycosylase domain-containing protein [Burkholderiales bacterium]|nr:transglycosylase domain-containing protein [Burkholderiales bacterium]
MLLATATSTALALPSFDEVRAAHRPSDIPLLDRHGAVIQWQRADVAARHGPWVTLAEVSPALREAVVLSEDRRFWAHGGVDWRALAASAWSNAWNTRTRGASTVTMQLAGLLDADLARPVGGRDIPTKVGQIVRAQQLEARWSKTQILETYLNVVPLRGELVGVGAASQQLFGKHASGLDALEAAVLAVLVRAPNAGAVAVARRACEVLREQASLVPTAKRAPAAQGEPQAAQGEAQAAQGEVQAAQGARDPCAGVATVTAQALARRPGPMLGEALAPHLARLMWREALAAPSGTTPSPAPAHAPAPARAPARTSAPAPAPRALHSTLDARVQRIAHAALRRQLAELRGRQVDDGAVLVLDNASGEVLAWVGSAGAGSGSGAPASEVDAVLARRQPGSTIKPFVYALALERRLVTAASRIDDSPLQLAAGSAGLYTPRNYDHAYRGGITVREALAGSVNVPAVRVAAMLEPEVLFDRLNASGLRLAQNAGYHGHALALGSADVTLLDLTNAYRMLARGGRWSPPRWRLEAPTAGGPAGRAVHPPPAARQVFSPEAAWLVSHILADPAARAASFGLDSPLVTRGHAAVKTGTSKDMRDNWCIGSTERFTVGVWVGNAGGLPMHAVSGVSGAAPVWREVVMALGPSRAPAPPPRLVAVAGEWFIAGTEPAAAHAARGATVAFEAGRAAAFGIESPRAGTVIAFDPEIPPAAQRVVLRGAQGQWWLNGRLLGTGTRLEWLPRPGRHVLERRDASASDRVEFEVRSPPAGTAGAAGAAGAKGTAASKAGANGVAPKPAAAATATPRPG